jgi:uncharacterized protein YciI
LPIPEELVTFAGAMATVDRRAVLHFVAPALVGAIVVAAIVGWPSRRSHGGPAMKSTFLVLYRPGPAWVVGKHIRDQPPKEHGKYMLQLYERGVMKSAGPFEDDTGAAIVLEAADQTEAQSLIEADPAIKARIFTHEIHPWGLVPWEKYVKKH